jgi:pimeloyl-ACP methyl ester carboxylesterase
MQNWDHVIRRLAQKYRAVRVDARARGKSGTSADYSVRAAVDDIGRVIDATDIRPILVGWSYGATIAVRYAAEEMRTVRAAVADAEASNERVSVFATTPHKHTQILNKAPDTVVAAIEDVIHRSR